MPSVAAAIADKVKRRSLRFMVESPGGIKAAWHKCSAAERGLAARSPLLAVLLVNRWLIVSRRIGVVSADAALRPSSEVFCHRGAHVIALDMPRRVQRRRAHDCALEGSRFSGEMD